jgi:hypothetical protein
MRHTLDGGSPENRSAIQGQPNPGGRGLALPDLGAHEIAHQSAPPVFICSRPGEPLRTGPPSASDRNSASRASRKGPRLERDVMTDHQGQGTDLFHVKHRRPTALEGSVLAQPMNLASLR